MRKISILFLFFIFHFSLSFSTVYLPLTAKMVVSSNSNIKIAAGLYSFTDSNSIGVIEIYNDSNVVIDGDSVYVDGLHYLGSMVHIHNSHNVTIKNFRSVKDYYYGFHADSSYNITIVNCNFSYNRKDTVGFLSISDDESWAYGGGIFMYKVKNSIVSRDTVQYENDGVAVYNCYQLHIDSNLVSWNKTYGIRMFHTDSSVVVGNTASHINRYTSPSDCAGILLYFSRANNIIHNDFSYSGDGIFTNANINLANVIPNFHDDNYFAWNYCSYSPNNAIESVFTDGNVFKHNTASYSNYGVWGGYAINLLVDSNTFNNNNTDGVAIEHGMHNTISNDSISGSGQAAVALWANSPAITGYDDRVSHFCHIMQNYISMNNQGIEMQQTDSSVASQNYFLRNTLAVQLDSEGVNDTIQQNTFLQNVSYDIRNNTANNVMAHLNQYGTNDTGEIDCKIYDHYDSTAAGIVYYMPFTPSGSIFQKIPPADLCEPGSAQWGAFVQDGLPTTLSWDYTDYLDGKASLKCITQSGFQVRLHYYPANDSVALWNLSYVNNIYISFKAIDTNQYGFQQTAVRIGDDCGGYIEYDDYADTMYKSTWRTYAIPINGDAHWTKNVYGAVSLADISYVEVIADTWGYGFTLWVDGLYFDPQPNTVNELRSKSEDLRVFPNPSRGVFTIEQSAEKQSERIEIYNVLGEKALTLALSQTGEETQIDLTDRPSGIYFYRITNETGNLVSSGKLIISK